MPPNIIGSFANLLPNLILLESTTNLFLDDIPTSSPDDKETLFCEVKIISSTFELNTNLPEFNIIWFWLYSLCKVGFDENAL